MDLGLNMWFLAALGGVSGVAAGFFGIGGGVIIVPVLLLCDVSMEAAIGVSIMQMVFSSIFGSLLNLYQKKLELRDGVFVGIGGLFGAAFSGVIVSFFSSLTLLIAFLALSCVSFYKYLFDVKTTPNPTPPITQPHKQKIVMVFAGALTGIFAVSLGVGGGLILAPILAYYLGFSSKKVVPIALFFIIFASVSGSISLGSHGFIDAESGLAVGISSMLGVGLGIFIMNKISLTNHRYALIGIYAFSILLTIYKLFQSL